MRKSAISFFVLNRITFLSLGLLLALIAFGTLPSQTNAQAGRIIRVVNVSTQQGQQVTVQIQIDSQGNEASISFSLNFDPTKLSNPQVLLGSGVPNGTSYGTNNSQVGSGRIGVLLITGNSFTAGTQQILTVRFDVAPGAPSSQSPITFGNTPTNSSVSSASGGNILPATYQGGTVTIGNPATATPTPVQNPSPTPTPVQVPSPTPTPVQNPTPTPVQNPSPTPTPVQVPSPTPTRTPTPTPTATPTPTPVPTPTPSPTRTPTPTPTPAGNTTPGANSFVGAPTGDASVSFSVVLQGGNTTFAPIDPQTAGTPPGGYLVLTSTPAYDVTTTATYQGPITVCFVVNLISDPTVFSRIRILHAEGGQLVDRTILPPDTPAPNFATRTVCARVNSLSPFVTALAPGTVSIEGQVFTPEGMGLRNATVVLTDAQGVKQTATTGSFGNYRFENIRQGEVYLMGVQSRRYRFATRSVETTANLTGVNFVGLQ